MLLTFTLSLALLYLYQAALRQKQPPGSTPTGAGILFPIAFLAATPFSWHLFSGLSLLTGISAWDDARPLPALLRLTVHLVASGLLLWPTLGDALPHFLLATLLLTGWLNACNFMDGINGMLALYSIVLLLSLSLASHPSPAAALASAGKSASGPLLGTLLAFLLLNFRRRALCFAGDTGSITLAAITTWLGLSIWQDTSNLYLFAFPALFLLDAGLTLLLRLFRGANILQSHREHLYERLAYSRGWDHRAVAAAYATCQLGINLLGIFLIRNTGTAPQAAFLIGVYGIGTAAYFLMLKKHPV